MSIEGDIRKLIKSAGVDLTEARVHELLLSIAELIGEPPHSVHGPGPEVVWPSVEDGIVVSPSRDRGELRVRVRSFGLEDTERSVYLGFEYATSVSELPYLWSLPVGVVERVTYGHPVVSAWDDFFYVYERCMDRLPGELALLPPAWVPPAWLPSGPVVVSVWNIEGSPYGGLAATITAAGVELFGEKPDGEAIKFLIPTERLENGDVSIPAILAGQTATGDYRELQFFENEIGLGAVYPCGVGRDDPSYPPEELNPGEKPPRTQSLDDVLALLGVKTPTFPARPVRKVPDPPGPAAESAPAQIIPSTPPTPPQPPAGSQRLVAPAGPARKPFWRRRPRPSSTPFVATMPPAHAVELATRLALNNHDAPAVLGGWAVVLSEQGRGALRLGTVNCQRADVGFRVGVELMPTGRNFDDAPGARAYAQELIGAVSHRFGPPAVIWAQELWGNWGWKVGEIGLAVQCDARGVTLAVVPQGDVMLQLLRDKAGGG